MAEDKKKQACEDCDEDCDMLTLEFDDGVQLDCEILGIFDVEDKEYIALLPEDGTDDVYLYGYKDLNDEEFDLIDIEDDEEFKKVSKVFEELVDEEDEE